MNPEIIYQFLWMIPWLCLTDRVLTSRIVYIGDTVGLKCYQCGGCGILFRLKSFSIYCWSYLSMSFINYVLLSKTFKILRGKTILYLLWCDPPRSFPRPTKLCSHYTHCKYFVSNIGVSFLFHFVKLLWALRATANIFSHLLKGGPGFFLNLWEPDVYRLKVLICRNGKLCSHNVKEDL